MGVTLTAGQTLTLHMRGRYTIRGGRIVEIDIEMG